MSNVVQFKADLAAMADELDIKLATFLKKITIEAFKGIVILTPVDTGRARASWALGIGAPSDFVPPEIPKEGRAAINTLKHAGKVPHPVFPKATPDYSQLASIDGTQPVFITSNLEYIEALENGHSKQAPAGMVRITVAALEIGLENLVSENTIDEA